MGYVPNLYARALVTGKTKLLGLIVPDITNPFFPPLVRAAHSAAEAHGMSVTLAETDSQPERERALIASLAPHCSGLIVASSRLMPGELRRVAEATRLVLVNNDTEGVARVLISSAEALEQGIRLMADKGARKFCYVGGPHRSWSDGERRTTVERVTGELGLEAFYLRDESGTYDEAREIAKRPELEADAVIAFDDVIACGVLDGLSDRGIEVPRDTALLGCDDALPIQTRPRLSTIRLQSAEGVREAVRMVTAATGSVVPEERILLPGVLVARETT